MKGLFWAGHLFFLVGRRELKGLLFLKSLFIFRERGRARESEGEKYLCEKETPISCAPPRDRTRNPSTYPDQELNQWPFALQNEAQPTEQQWSVVANQRLFFFLTIQIASSFYGRVGDGEAPVTDDLICVDQKIPYWLIMFLVLTGWLPGWFSWFSWLEYSLWHQKFAGSIPGRGAYYERQMIDVFLSYPCSSLSLCPPTFSLSKINKQPYSPDQRGSVSWVLSPKVKVTGLKIEKKRLCFWRS